jgi:hypothetical protein
MTHALPRPARLFTVALAAGVAVFAGGIVAAPDAAHAASLAVSTTDDVLDAGACTAITVASLPGTDGEVSLREAICATNNEPGADVISLPAGTFVLTGARGEDNGQTGDFDVLDSLMAGNGPVPGDGLSIVGAGAAATIIDGAGLDRIFDVIAFGAFTFTLSDTTLRNGDADAADGGAIQAVFGPATELFDVVIEGSSAINGGAVASIMADLTMFGTTIRDNTATAQGGGVYAVGPLRMQATTVSGNSAADGGGLALESDASDVSTIEQSTISGNHAVGLGGGIQFSDFHAGQTTVTDTTIADNVADLNGGGIFTTGASGQVGLYSTTITGNSSGGVGGIVHSGGFAILEHSIVAENSDTDLAGNWFASDNIVGIAGGGVADGVNDNRAGSAASPLDPELRELGLYGGTTQVRVPLPGSPAIDTALDCGAIDQRWETRVVGAGCDVGAVELTAAPDTTIVSGPGAASMTASASFALAASGGTGPYTFECALDGGAYTPCANPLALSGLADGAHTLSVRAVDGLGSTDVSSAEHVWSVTTTPTEIAATGAADTVFLLGGAGAMLICGFVLVELRRRALRN